MNRAAKVLKDVQEACKTLENNLNEVARKHKQLQEISYLESSLNKKDDELMRIRKNVNKKIQEIESEIKYEIQEKSKYMTEKKSKTSLSRGQRVLHQRHPSSIENKTVTSFGAKKLQSNVLISTVTGSKFQKTTEKKSKFSSQKVYDQFIEQHLLGNQPQRVHLRSPSKSPLKVQQGGALKMANNVFNDLIQIKKSQNKENVHPQLNLSFNPAFHNCLINDDVLGTAIPLANPNQDPRCRLSLFYEPLIEIKTNDLKITKGPNVAVINMRSDSFAEIEPLSNVKSRLKAKVRQRIRNKMKMSVQNLPNIDIDTSLFSSSSISNITCEITNNQSKDSNNENKESENADNLSYHFQDHIKDIPKENIVEDESEKSLSGKGFLISGFQQADKFKNESGPAFSPTHVQSRTLYSVPTLSSNQLQMKAQEWLEHELLSRIVHQLNDKGTDPTLKEVADTIKVQSVFNEEEENENPRDWIENVIGLKGLQMFVEAGIPIDSNLVDELIRSVLLDMLVTMYGHPPQFTNEKNLKNVESKTATPIPTPIHTPARSNSPLVSALTVLLTPEKSISELSEQLLDEVEIFEESVFPNAIHHSPIETPSSSIICLSENENNKIETPEASLYFLEETNHISIDTPKQTLTPVESLMKSLSISNSLSIENKNGSFEFHLIPVTETEPVTSISPISVYETTSISTGTPTTSVGISTFEGISVGELLNPSFAEVYDGVSEGELGFPLSVKISNLLHEYPEDLKDCSQDTKMILKKMIGSCHSKKKKSEENVPRAKDSLCSVGEYKVKSFGEVSFKDESAIHNDYFEFDISADPLKSAGEILYEMLVPPKKAPIKIAGAEDDEDKMQIQSQVLNSGNTMFKSELHKIHLVSNDFSTIMSEGEINSNIQHNHSVHSIDDISLMKDDDITLMEDDLSQYELSS